MTDLVRIDGLTFDGEGKSNWIYSKLKGWYGSPPMRAELEDRPVSDGAFGIAEAYRSARVLTFTGVVYAESFKQAESEFWDAIAAVQEDGKPFELSVETDNGKRSCMVTLSGSFEIDESADSPNAASVTAQFIAPDPVKYGPSRDVVIQLATPGGGLEYPLHSPSGALYYGSNGTLGRGTLTNFGTARVWPKLEVTGGLTLGFFVQRLDTGQVVRYDRSVPAGTVTSINQRTGEVMIDGVSNGSTYLTRDEFFSVGPGESVEVQFNAIAGSSGTPELTVTLSDGWW